MEPKEIFIKDIQEEVAQVLATSLHLLHKVSGQYFFDKNIVEIEQYLIAIKNTKMDIKGYKRLDANDISSSESMNSFMGNLNLLATTDKYISIFLSFMIVIFKLIKSEMIDRNDFDGYLYYNFFSFHYIITQGMDENINCETFYPIEWKKD